MLLSIASRRHSFIIDKGLSLRASERPASERVSGGKPSTHETTRGKKNMSNQQKTIDFESPCPRGHIDIMPPTKHATTRERGGYDTIELLASGEWINDFEEFTDFLRDMQQEAQDGQSGNIDFVILNQPVYVSPSGARRGLYCSFVLRWEGITFSIVNRKKSSGSSFGVHISIGSLVCMQKTGAGAVKQARAFLRSLGFRCALLRLSRVDVCVDVPGVDTGDIVNNYMAGNCVKRARKAAIYQTGKRFNAISLGSGKSVKLRIYDKLLELSEQSIKDNFKLDYLIKNRWEGKVPEFATRVEYQLRRDALKEFGIDTFADFEQRAGEVCGWLTSEWFRLTKKAPKKGHTKEAKVSKFWRLVQKDFFIVFGSPAAPKMRSKARPLTTQLTALKKQVDGCLSTILAACGSLPETADQLFSNVCRVLFSDDVSGVIEAIKEKRASYETWLPSYGYEVVR